MEKGYVHVYTGNGKGKTTSAIGLMVRAVGAGKRIYFGQFMKEGEYCEIKMLRERFPEITVEQYGGGLLLNNTPGAEDLQKAGCGLKKASEAIMSGMYDMAVLDEINVALFMELVSIEDVLNIIKNKPEALELVLTGRYADEKIIRAADLVSDIVQIKHYFTDGVVARSGIEM